MEPGIGKSAWASGLEGGVGPSTDHTPSHDTAHPETQTWTTQARDPARTADPAPARVYGSNSPTSGTSGTTNTNVNIDDTTGSGAGPSPLDEAQQFFQQELSEISGSFPSRQEVARRQAEDEQKPASAAAAGDGPGVPLSEEEKQAAKEEAMRLSAEAGLPRPGAL